jgi:hypothetical protein
MTNKQFLTKHPPELGDIVVCEGGERWVCLEVNFPLGAWFYCLDREACGRHYNLPPILALWRARKGGAYSGYPSQLAVENGNLTWSTDFIRIAKNQPKSESLQRIESAEKKLREAQEELRLAREASK